VRSLRSSTSTRGPVISIVMHHNSLQTQARHILHFVYMKMAACHYLDIARRTERFQFFNCMTAMAYSAFCIEAFLNEIGQALYKDNWATYFEQKPTKEKLRIIERIWECPST